MKRRNFLASIAAVPMVASGIPSAMAGGRVHRIHGEIENVTSIGDCDIVSINSLGGSVFRSLALHKDIADRGLDVHVSGTCAGASMLLLVAGSKRTCDPEAIFMFRKSRGVCFADTDSMYRRLLFNCDKAIVRVLSRFTLMDGGYIRRAMAGEWTIGAREALAMGLVDEIVAHCQLST